MKILVIHGSMRKGKTYELTNEIVARLTAKPDVEISQISVCDLDLPFCCSCHVCFSNGEEHCPHYEIVKKTAAAISSSDGIIVSGTTYMWALNAAMKNLLDHLAYEFHRPSFFGKKGMVIATSKGAGEKNVTKYLKTVLGQWGINGALVVTRNAKEVEMVPQNKQSRKLDIAANRFYELVLSKRQISPSFKNIIVHNAFRAMSLSGLAESECDEQYWSQDGFRERAYPVKIGVFKYAVGAVVYCCVRGLVRVIDNEFN